MANGDRFGDYLYLLVLMVDNINQVQSHETMALMH